MLTNDDILKELKNRLDQNEENTSLIEKQNEELAKVNHMLSESEQLKSHFISNITNEIVNPFASILGLSRNIISASESDYKKVKNMAELIHSEAFELDFQLNNIFTAAKIEAGEAQPEYVKTDVNHLVSSVVGAYRYKAEQKQLDVNFVFDFGPQVQEGSLFITDPQKLKLIISNLMSNGIKYSNAANRIEIKAWLEEDLLKVTVKDFGIGIAKNDLDVIFDRFKRLDSSIHSLNPGHGLGLSVTKALLDALNGEIDIKSQQNLGSLFAISIPQGEVGDDDDGFATDGNEFIFESDDEIF